MTRAKSMSSLGGRTNGAAAVVPAGRLLGDDGVEAGRHGAPRARGSGSSS